MAQSVECLTSYYLSPDLSTYTKKPGVVSVHQQRCSGWGVETGRSLKLGSGRAAISASQWALSSVRDHVSEAVREGTWHRPLASRLCTYAHPHPQSASCHKYCTVYPPLHKQGKIVTYQEKEQRYQKEMGRVYPEGPLWLCIETVYWQEVGPMEGPKLQ